MNKTTWQEIRKYKAVQPQNIPATLQAFAKGLKATDLTDEEKEHALDTLFIMLLNQP